MEKCEICKKEYLTVDRHHIQSKIYGGSDHNWNIAEICQNCHRNFVHHGLIIIEGRFDSTRGSIIVWRKYNEDSITGVIDPKVWIYPNAIVNKLNESIVEKVYKKLEAR